jgi:hypothetical protein
MKRAAVVLAILSSTAASAAPFTVTITNSGTDAAYGWSSGLLTLNPLITIGPSPRSGNEYFTYQFANSNCGVTNDNGNATLLATRWGLTLGVNAWLVPAIPANGGSATVTIDAPVGSTLSYIAWVANTSVFDDFVAMHAPGTLTNLRVRLFNGTVPVENVDFVISGYDTNSTSPTDGSGDTCSPECPVPANTACFVAPGNASGGAAGSFPVPPTPNAALFTATTSATQNRLWWTNIGPHQGVVVARHTSPFTWTPTNGTTYAAGQAVGPSATGTLTPDQRRDMEDNEIFTLNDGVNAPTVFEFDKDGNGVAAPRVRIDISSPNNLSQSGVGDRIVTAINGVGPTLRIVASKSANGSQVLLRNELPGTAGNIGIMEAVTSFTATGMAGGAAAQATVVYVDNGAGAANRFIDTGVTAGTRYHYKVFSHANSLQYAPGTVSLFSETTSSTGGSPLWCYSVGMPSMQQPVTQVGSAVYTSSQTGWVTANLTTPTNPGTDGNEKWRPVPLGGSSQIRPLLVPTQVGDLLITGDSLGFGFAINPANGAMVWRALNGAKMGNGLLGSGILAQPAAQLFAYSNAAFQAANPARDLVFFATRNSNGSTDNVIYALSSRDGSQVWATPAGASLGIVTGGMAIHYATNRLYVGARNGLFIYNSITGARVAGPLNFGALDYGVNFDYGATGISGLAIINTAGFAYGLTLAGAVRWGPFDVGPTTNYIYPTGNGFIGRAPSRTEGPRSTSRSTSTPMPDSPPE